MREREREREREGEREREERRELGAERALIKHHVRKNERAGAMT